MTSTHPLLLHAPTSLKTLSPSFSITVPSVPYIIGLALLPTSVPIYAVSTSQPSTAIQLYTPSPSGLTQTLSLQIGGNGPTSTRVAHNFGGRPTLLSSQRHQGCVKVWDERKGDGPVIEFLPPKNRAILSFDVSSDGFTLAGGTDLESDDASIFYWDPRNPSQLQRTHSSTHADDITTLQFHPAQPGVLLSASTDGLLSTSDALAMDEDDAVEAVANWGCSIARAGWTCDHRVWAASDMETFGVWNNDLDLLNDFGDVRRPALPGFRWTTDYHVDAIDFSSTGGHRDVSGLALFLGSNSGDIALACVSDPPYCEADAPTWTVRTLLRGGHVDSVVRSVLWDHTNDLLLSGDEAGHVTGWRFEPSDDADVEMADAGAKGSGGGGTKRGREDCQEDINKRGRFRP